MEGLRKAIAANRLKPFATEFLTNYRSSLQCG
jgi:hypothetical protein